jgi:hypothetical protein
MTLRSTLRGAAVLGLLLATLPPAARAADPGDPWKVRVNLAFFAGIQKYSMSDINDEIEAVNADVHSNPTTSDADFNMDPLRGGMGLGAGVRVWPRERIVVMADWTRLTGSSSDIAPINDQPGAPSLKVKTAVPAQSVGLTVGYFFYRPLTKLHVGVGLGGAYYICDGDYETTYPGYHSKIELHGTGFGAHGLLLGDLRLSNVVRLEAAVGYRMAKTTDLKHAGVVQLNADGSKTQVDYSGLVTRVGIDIPFGPVK